jgi:hypothetical protein
MWLRVLEVELYPLSQSREPTPADKPPGLVDDKSTFPQIPSDFYQEAKILSLRPLTLSSSFRVPPSTEQCNMCIRNFMRSDMAKIPPKWEGRR